MKGTIRPISRQSKCPKCGKEFIHINKLGYGCVSCQITPTRFFIDLFWKGKRLRIGSDRQGQPLDTYSRAYTLLNKIQYEIENQAFEPSLYVISDYTQFYFEVQIAKFLKEKEIEEEKGNIAISYLAILKRYAQNYYLSFFKGKDVREIRTVTIREFYNQLPRQSEKTIKNIMDALKHFFNILLRDEIIAKVPIFPSLTVSERSPAWTTAENQLKLLKAIPDEHRAIFTFTLLQGVRPSESRALKWKDVDFEKGMVVIRRTFSDAKIVERTKGKNVKPRLLHPYVVEALQSLQRGLPEAFVFLNPHTNKHYSRTRLKDIFMIARRKTGIDISIYEAGRHSVATNAILAGVSIMVIRDYLGHADAKTTEKYTHLDVIAQKQIFEKAEVIKMGKS
ncbi:MAG: site-specific integrase [Nitrospirae bacterium]|uniref:tyrosine-type recombinase/integrase n=1 Tax=Candidatus Magnetobacterium casense TaxID=1455061 RepID=UPI00138DED46|nr:site-specific integrase [Candidatus Magnetobacterium casensis]MBF0338266.1 site-specific integrase [Nitrospirota bacterium]